MIVWFSRDASDSAMLSQYLFALLDRRLTFRDTHTEISRISAVQPKNTTGRTIFTAIDRRGTGQ
jgi:hypothetical protein